MEHALTSMGFARTAGPLSGCLCPPATGDSIALLGHLLPRTSWKRQRIPATRQQRVAIAFSGSSPWPEFSRSGLHPQRTDRVDIKPLLPCCFTGVGFGTPCARPAPGFEGNGQVPRMPRTPPSRDSSPQQTVVDFPSSRPRMPPQCRAMADRTLSLRLDISAPGYGMCVEEYRKPPFFSAAARGPAFAHRRIGQSYS